MLLVLQECTLVGVSPRVAHDAFAQGKASVVKLAHILVLAVDHDRSFKNKDKIRIIHFELVK